MWAIEMYLPDGVTLYELCKVETIQGVFNVVHAILSKDAKGPAMLLIRKLPD